MIILFIKNILISSKIGINTAIDKLVSCSPAYFKKENFIKEENENKIEINYPNSTSKITQIRNKYYCTAGSTIYNGQMNEFLNNPIPNATYIVDEYSEYKIDSQGRTKSVISNRTKLYNQKCIRNNVRNSDIQKIVREKGFPCDDGGHLISANTNGANELINQVPMEHTFQANGGGLKNLKSRLLNLVKMLCHTEKFIIKANQNVLIKLNQP